MKFSRKKFFDAIKSNDLDLINDYLSKGIDVNITDKRVDGFTGVYSACFYNNTELCKQLLQKGASINTDKNILFWPCHKSNNELFMLLLDYKVYYDNLTLSKNLWEACTRDNLFISTHLVRLGADVNYSEDGITPLHRASRYGSIDLVKFLHKAGANIDARSYNNYTPIMYAVQTDKFDLVEYFFKAGADLEGIIIKNKQGFEVGIIAESAEMSFFYKLLINGDKVKVADFKDKLKNGYKIPQPEYNIDDTLRLPKEPYVSKLVDTIVTYENGIMKIKVIPKKKN